MKSSGLSYTIIRPGGLLGAVCHISALVYILTYNLQLRTFLTFSSHDYRLSFTDQRSNDNCTVPHGIGLPFLFGNTWPGWQTSSCHISVSMTAPRLAREFDPLVFFYGLVSFCKASVDASHIEWLWQPSTGNGILTENSGVAGLISRADVAALVSIFFSCPTVDSLL